MKKYIYLILILISCTKNKNIIGFDNQNYLIQGRWVTKNSSFDFNKNGIFKYSYYNIINASNTISSLTIIKGNYYFENEFINFSSIYVDTAYGDLPDIRWVAGMLSKKWEIISDTLYLTEVNMFSEENYDETLEGNWSETFDVCVYKINPFKIEHVGKMKLNYLFSKPSIDNEYQKYRVLESSEFITDYEMNSMIGDYECKYKPPELIFPPGISRNSIIVEFKNEKMYWIRETKAYYKEIN